MSLAEQLSSDMKAAMRAGDTLKRDTVRMMIAAFKNKRIELGAELDEGQELAVLRSAVKSRQDSAEQYEKAGRNELAQKERSEIEVIQAYLPKQLDEDATRDLVGNLVRELGISSKRDIGVLMKSIMKDHKGLVDGKLVQRFAAELLE